MITKYEKVNSLLFDGSQEGILNKPMGLDTKIDTGAPVKFNDFANHTFEDLRKILDDDDFEFIVKTGEFTGDDGFLNLYKGTDNLRLYYLKRDNIIMVFAFGEFQPTRYKLYLEGVWKLRDK